MNWFMRAIILEAYREAGGIKATLSEIRKLVRRKYAIYLARLYIVHNNPDRASVLDVQTWAENFGIEYSPTIPQVLYICGMAVSWNYDPYRGIVSYNGCIEYAPMPEQKPDRS